MNKHVEPPVRPGARAAPAAGRADAFVRQENSRAKDIARFKAAVRHSRRVRFYRWMLPVGVVVALGGTLAYNYLGSLTISVNLPFELGRVSLSGTRVKMEFPQLHGFTADNRGYNVSAESAFQDLKNPGLVELETIKASLELADRGWAHLVAATGSYDTKTEGLKLGGGVRFDTSSGYGGVLKDASINIKTGVMVSDKPVELTYLDSKVTADSIEVSQKDSRALLVGNVQLDLIMPPDDGEKASADPATRPAASAAAATPVTASLAAESPAASGRATPVAASRPAAAPATAPLVISSAPARAPVAAGPAARAEAPGNSAGIAPAASVAAATLPVLPDFSDTAPGTYGARVGPVPITTSASFAATASLPAAVPLPPRRPPPMLRGSTTVGAAP